MSAAPHASDAAARERRARALGVAVGLVVAAVAAWTIRWPAPAIAAACGYGAYVATRGPRRPTA